ncbi:MAG: phosphate butyryltransferase [Clostridia bacterium]|nr:phosphate butyryltransferase [Clostridia bacterium]
MIRSMDQFVEVSKKFGRKKISVAAAHDESVLHSVNEAYKLGLIDAVLVGDKEKILEISDRIGLDVLKFEIIKENDIHKAARIAVDIASSGEANALMKGNIMTGDFLKVVLDKASGLRTSRVLSHVSVFELQSYHKLLFLTDAALNIQPDLGRKADIIQNSVEVACALGIDVPKVAILAAVEVVNPDMQCTLDAAALSKMVDRGQIKNCIVDGPLAMDNAINMEAAVHKGIKSPVAGDADILVVPDIEAGNILHKSLVFLGRAKSCAVITGARVPLVVTSRAEDYIAKLYSIALASIVSAGNSK